jgi:carboxyl-terminal processing protease
VKPAVISLLLVLLLSSCSAATPTAEPAATASPEPSPTPTLPPDLQTYLDTAIDLVQEKSIYSASTDWEYVRSQANQAAAGAQTTEDLYPILILVLHLTGDRHGYVMPSTKVESYYKDAPITMPLIQYELLEGRLGSLTVPTFSNGNKAAVQQFAGDLQDAIRVLDASQPCGWVLDLRNNEGGNGFAMLAGVAPLLGEGVYGYYAYPDGSRSEWRSEAGKIYLGDVMTMELAGPAYELRQPGNPIAVLTNEVTTSSGELLAIAFHGWSFTRSFGQETLGRTTVPAGYFLEDGAFFAFSSAYFADHTGEIFRDSFLPDVRIPAHEPGMLRDRSVPDKAIEWLLSQPACEGK